MNALDGQLTEPGESQDWGEPGMIEVAMRPQQPVEAPFVLNRGVSLATPAELPARPDSMRRVSYDQEDLQKTASQYVDVLPVNRVSRNGDVAVFDPNWIEAPSLANLAYCTYDFSIEGYATSGENQTIGFNWQVPPAMIVPGGDDELILYVGLGDWNSNTWHWYEGPADFVLTLASFTPYIDGSGRMLMMIVLLGDESAELSSLRVGDLEMRPLGDLDASAPALGAPPLDSGILPGSADLSPDMSPIREQDPWGSCTAFSCGDGAYNYILGQIYDGWDFANPFNLVSPKHLYVASWDATVPKPLFLDSGRNTDQVAAFLTTDGVCTEETVPYTGSLTDPFPPAAAEEAALLRADYVDTVPCNTDSGIVSVKEVLANQTLPVIMRVNIDDVFGLIGDETVWNYNGNYRGGHSMCIAGYDDAKSAFKVRNSWGTDWGVSGYFWMGYDTFKMPTAEVRCYVLRDSYSAEVDEYFVGGAGNPTPPPTNVRASDGTHTDYIRVTWDKAPGAGEYKIYRDISSNLIATVGDVDRYDDETASFNSHAYWVSGVFGGTEGSLSTPDSGYLQQGITITGVSPTEGTTNSYVTFYVYTYGEPPTGYSWDFGGGATPNTSSLESPTVQLSGTAGFYNCSVTVDTTTGDAVHDFVLTVQYHNDPPVASLSADPLQGPAPLDVDFDASFSTDPDGDDEALHFYWDWDGDGTYEYDGGTQKTQQHKYNSPGSYTCTVKVVDEGGAEDTATATITVVPTGQVEWKHSWGAGSTDNGKAAGAASNGKAYLLGFDVQVDPTPVYLLTAVCYNNTEGPSYGDFQWARDFRFGSGDVAAYGGWVAADGTSYICGYTDCAGGAGNPDMLVVKVAANGDYADHWIGGGKEDDRARNMYVDGSGNVYLSGYTTSWGGGGKDYIVVKLNADLNAQWALTWGTNSTGEEAWGVTVAPEGDIYLFGGSDQWDASGDGIMVYCPSDGDKDDVWAYRWSTSSSDGFFSAELDPFGNLIVGGGCNSPPAASGDLLVVKVDPNPGASSAALVWSKLHGGTDGDVYSDLAVDSSGNIFLYGHYGSTWTPGGTAKVTLSRLDFNGTLLWNKQWSGTNPNYGWYASRSCSLDSAGNLYLAGNCQDATGNMGTGSFTEKDISATWAQVSAPTLTVLEKTLTENTTATIIESGSSGTEDSGGGGEADELIIKYDTGV